MLDVTLRIRRQVTLPAEVCKALDLQVGDHLELSLEDGTLVLRPRKVVAVQALRAIQQAFAESGLSETELQAEGRRVREQLSRAR